MKKALLVSLFGMGFVGQLLAADAVESYGHGGQISARTVGIQYQEKKVTIPFLGTVSIWVPVTKEDNAPSENIQLNGDTASVDSVSKFLSPNYSAKVEGAATFVNTSAYALYKGSLTETVSLAPKMVAHLQADAFSTFEDNFQFKIGKKSVIDLIANADPEVEFVITNVSTGEVIYTHKGNDSYGMDLDAGTYILSVAAELGAVKDTQLNVSTNTGNSSVRAEYSLKISA